MHATKGPLVWIDLEMTGLDPDRCHVLAIATVVTSPDLDVLAEGPDLVLHASEEQIATCSDWSREQFTKSGLLERARASTVSVAEAEERTLAFLVEHVEDHAAPLCGNSVHTDRAFLWRHMRRLHEFLHYRNVDVSTLKEVLRRWYPASWNPPAKAGRHEARSDVLESIEELRYYRETFLRAPSSEGRLSFGHIEIPCSDVGRSAAFYRDALGFRQTAEQGPYRWMERDGLEVLLRPDGGSHGLVFYTGDPENLAEEIRGRGLAVERRGNGYHLEDPDGYDIQMVDPTEDHSQPAR